MVKIQPKSTVENNEPPYQHKDVFQNNLMNHSAFRIKDLCFATQYVLNSFLPGKTIPEKLIHLVNPITLITTVVVSILAAVIQTVALIIFGLLKIMDIVAPKLPRPLEIVINIIHATITEVLALLVLSATYFVDLEKRDPKEIINNQKPILLIHGLYHNSACWLYYRNILNKADVGPVFTINLGSPFNKIEDHAEKVKEKVAEIQKQTGRKDIMLVGHSMGGLVASEFALRHADQETQVTDIVTIGTPLKGTPIAYMGFGKDAKQLRHNCSYIKELSKSICEQNKIRYFHIGTETDELVVPYNSSLLLENKKAKHLKISNLGHIGIVFSDRIIDAVIDHYKEGITQD